jgi:hypothetical protein
MGSHEMAIDTGRGWIDDGGTRQCRQCGIRWWPAGFAGMPAARTRWVPLEVPMNRYCPLLTGLALAALALATCVPAGPQLLLEEHALSGRPVPVPLQFEPAGSSQQAVLDEHRVLRRRVYSQRATTIDGLPALASIGDEQDLVAVLDTATSGEPRQTVTVRRGDNVIFSVDAGLPSPLLPLQGLWAFGDHWALELVYADASTFMGKVYIDGEPVVTPEGNQESFGFQLLAERPFYFLSRGGKIGYNYDGREVDLHYGQILHYNCCAESTLNPVQAEDMVAFFAREADRWYYIELGAFGR